jgi:hypothetical protein
MNSSVFFGEEGLTGDDLRVSMFSCTRPVTKEISEKPRETTSPKLRAEGEGTHDGFEDEVFDHLFPLFLIEDFRVDTEGFRCDPQGDTHT